MSLIGGGGKIKPVGVGGMGLMRKAMAAADSKPSLTAAEKELQELRARLAVLEDEKARGAGEAGHGPGERQESGAGGTSTSGSAGAREGGKADL